MKPVILIHRLAHARGERVSAGPGIEYMVGQDGLLYVCEVQKGVGKGKFRVAAHPGVYPDHVAALTASPNIEVHAGYSGPTVNLGAVAAVAPADSSVPKADHDRIVARLQGEIDQLKAENAALKAVPPVAPAAPAAPAPVTPPPAPPPPAPTPAPPPAEAPPVAPAAPADIDLAAVLGLSVVKLGARVATGEFDRHLGELQKLEAAGKNRTSALDIFAARLQAIAV